RVRRPRAHRDGRPEHLDLRGRPPRRRWSLRRLREPRRRRRDHAAQPGQPGPDDAARDPLRRARPRRALPRLAERTHARRRADPRFRLRFLATWSALFAPFALAISLLELPVIRAAFGERPERDSGALCLRGILGVFGGSILAQLVPAVRAAAPYDILAFGAAG